MIEGWQSGATDREFTQYICACVYGALEFNERRFSYVYDTHVKNVQSYFEHRSHDLLIMDICGGEGWWKLSQFLGLATPDIPFPHWNSRPIAAG